jgi:hypothetical protein
VEGGYLGTDYQKETTFEHGVHAGNENEEVTPVEN